MTIKTLHVSTGVAFIAMAVLTAPVAAAVIDFEAVPGSTPADKLAITTQYLATHGVSFSLSTGDAPFLEAVGGVDSGDGFLNDQRSNAADLEAVGFEGGLGSHYLRIGTTDLSSAPVPALIIAYAAPVGAASGEIWDIDGNQFGTEQWQITALDGSDAVLASILSPLGVDFGPSSLDGKPWAWSFDLPSDVIETIRVDFVGSKAVNIGLAFDNFSPSSAIVPVPAAAWLLASALALLGRARRITHQPANRPADSSAT